jgi:hypothetical protein
MKRVLLAGALLVGVGATTAHAAPCGVIATTGTIQWYGNCSSDNQANDGDDVKAFVDKTVEIVPDGTAIDMSLGANNQAFDNVHTVGNGVGGGFETDGSGFANFKSTLAGSTSNPLTEFTFTTGSSTTLPDGTPYKGFDGELFRGQIDNTGTGRNKYNGELFVTVNFADAPSESYLYTGLSDKNDFGVLGFDEVPGMEHIVSSVTMSLDTGGAEFGAWNEFKQIDFSVPGAIAPIPIPGALGLFMGGMTGLIVLSRRARNTKPMV